MTKASAKNNKTRPRDASARVATAPAEAQASEIEHDEVVESGRGAKGKAGVPGSKNDSRRCTATANRTGERCRAPAILGGTVCRMHGGSLPQVKKAAKDRLLELVDPALAALHKVLADPDTDDTVKVRAALGILDRTGFRPGVVVEVATDDKWSLMLSDAAAMVDDRSLGGSEQTQEIQQYAMQQLAYDAQADAWRDYDNEEARDFEAGRIRPDENTVRGAVVATPTDEDA